jgi:hypothetical protein
MACAIFYNHQDMGQIAAEPGRTDLSPGDYAYGQLLWSGGLSDWSSAPPAPANSPYYGEGVADGNPTLMVVLNAPGVTKDATVEWLTRLAPTSACYYLEAIALDMASTAVEPWPPT